MFPHTYFNLSYFAHAYFPGVGEDFVPPNAFIEIIGTEQTTFDLIGSE